MKKTPDEHDGGTPAREPANDWRFERCTRLFGRAGMERLAGSNVSIFGLGGVGSYVAEGLARSGVGHITLVDFDRVCITNVNRQLHALSGTVGEYKAGVMGARLRIIAPKADVRVFTEFYDKDTSGRLLTPQPDMVVDCIDNVTAKMHLVATCVALDIPIVTVLGSGGKVDPTAVRVVPLASTHMDPLGRALRKHIRRKHSVTEEQLGRVMAVFSDEPVARPIVDHAGPVCGVDCVCPGSDNIHHTCRKRHVILGSAVFVTAVFGMAAASAAVRMLLGTSPVSRALICSCGNVLDPARPSKKKHKKGVVDK